MNIAFWGTPPLTTTILDQLENSGYTPVVVITGPDKKVGRGLTLTSPAPKVWAEKRGIPVFQPEKFDEQFFIEIEKYSLDLSIVVAYGKILPKKLIDMPRHGTWNIHYSLLPRWRGATPVEAAILAGDNETGVSIQQMAPKLDSGDVIAESQIKLWGVEKAPELRETLNSLAGPLLIETLKKVEAGSISKTPQNEEFATHCGKMSKVDGEINPEGNPIENDRKFRAYFAWPGTYFFTERADKTVRVIIKDAELKNGKFAIKRVLPENKKEMAYEEFVRQL
jgi:methionyl-tRNA formyltransferase